MTKKRIKQQGHQEVTRGLLELAAAVRALGSANATLFEEHNENESKRRKWWHALITGIALIVALASVLIFSLWPLTYVFDGWWNYYLPIPKQTHSYTPICVILYGLWLVGVPTLVAWDYYYFYPLCREPLEEFKHRADVTKAGWVPVAVILTAIFALRMHFDMS